jgi:hypothetical protein
MRTNVRLGIGFLATAAMANAIADFLLPQNEGAGCSLVLLAGYVAKASVVCFAGWGSWQQCLKVSARMCLTSALLLVLIPLPTLFPGPEGPCMLLDFQTEAFSLWYPLAFLVEALVLWRLSGIPRSSIPAAKPWTTALNGNVMDIGLRELPAALLVAFLPPARAKPQPASVDSMVVTPVEVSVEAGHSYALTARLYPKNGARQVIIHWTTSDSRVATPENDSSVVMVGTNAVSVDIAQTVRAEEAGVAGVTARADGIVVTTSVTVVRRKP